jgi:hypothetical protein
MAGPQFFTPKSVQPSRPRKHFTLEQANRSLSLVRRIVGDVVVTHQRFLRLQDQLEKASAKDQPFLQKDLELAMNHLEDYVDELSEIGCDLKDYQSGLIDFTGRHQGRDVCLCWKLGEEKISYWHEADTGFAGRQPVSTLVEND